MQAQKFVSVTAIVMTAMAAFFAMKALAFAPTNLQDDTQPRIYNGTVALGISDDHSTVVIAIDQLNNGAAQVVLSLGLLEGTALPEAGTSAGRLITTATRVTLYRPSGTTLFSVAGKDAPPLRTELAIPVLGIVSRSVDSLPLEQAVAHYLTPPYRPIVKTGAEGLACGPAVPSRLLVASLNPFLSGSEEILTRQDPCSAGGPGSGSCSIGGCDHSDPSGAESCTVGSCAQNYYPCCYCDPTWGAICRCVQDIHFLPAP